MQKIRSGDIASADEDFATLSADIVSALACIRNDPIERESKMSYTIEKAITPRILHQFFLTGRLISQRELSSVCNDEEFLGAVIAFSQVLARYVVSRAAQVSLSLFLFVSICIYINIWE